MINKKCCLVVGHSEKSQGAVNERHTVTEFEFNKKLAESIASLIPDLVDIVYRKTYRELPAQLNKMRPIFIVSMHCNAFNKRASGCEVLYYRKSIRGMRVASLFQGNLQASLLNRDRGIKGINSEDRGGYLLKNTYAPAVLCEPFFIDSNYDYDNAVIRLDNLTRAYSNAIKQTFGYLGVDT